MALDDMDGIADFQFIANETEKLTWETTSDWDNNVASTRTVHPSDTLRLGIGLDSFEYLTDGDSLPSPYNSTNLNASDSRAYNGSISARSTGGGGGASFPVSITNDSDTWQFLYNESSNQSGFALSPINSNGNPILWAGSNNPEAIISDGTGSTELNDPQTYDYGYWRRWTITFDFTTDEFYAEWEDLSGNVSDELVSGNAFANSSSQVDAWEVRTDNPWSGSCDACWYDNAEGVYTDGSLTTATKSFSGPEGPSLENLSYTLNGESIVVDIIGSPGTTDEEIFSQTLDGADSYLPLWADSHQDFQLKLNLDTTSPGTTPSVTRIELVP